MKNARLRPALIANIFLQSCWHVGLQFHGGLNSSSTKRPLVIASLAAIRVTREARGWRRFSAASHPYEFASALRFLAAARADAVAAADQVNSCAASCQAV
jgi:hypothetical protein